MGNISCPWNFVVVWPKHSQDCLMILTLFPVSFLPWCLVKILIKTMWNVEFFELSKKLSKAIFWDLNHQERVIGKRRVCCILVAM